MNTWWKVADWLESGSFEKALDGLEVVHASEMPEEVKVEAAELMQQLFDLERKLKEHSKHVLSKMDGVMWPVI